MGTNCASILAELFLYSYEHDLLDSLLRSGHRRLNRSFINNLCCVYMGGLIVFDNKKFIDYVKENCPSQLNVNKGS